MLEAQALNEWLSNRRLRQEGETYADELGRMTEALIGGSRSCATPRRSARAFTGWRDVAAGRNTSDSQVYGGLM